MSYIIAKYLRISDEDVDLGGLVKQESNSISGQRALLDDFIKRNSEFDNCEIIEAIDDGRTGTNFLRFGAQSLIEMAQQGKVKCIIVKDLSRWGRNYIEVGDFLEQKFPAWGVRFISIGDNYDSKKINCGTSGIDIAFRNLIYSLYSQDLSAKCRSGKDSAIKSGKIICTYPTFGYDKDKNDRHKFVVDPADAAIVKRIFDMAEQGIHFTEIVKVLNAENVPTKQMSKQRKGYTKKWGSGDCWDNSAVLDTLRNECYTGKWIYGKSRTVQIGSTKSKRMPRSEWIILPNAIPVLISDEQFNTVQEKLDAVFKGNANRKPFGTAEPKTIFSKIVKCAKCGRVMDFYSRATRLGAFRCKMPKRSSKFGCTIDRIEESDLINTVITILEQQVILADLHQSLKKAGQTDKRKSPKTIQVDIQNLQNLTEQTKSTKINLWERCRDGSISRERFQADSEQLNNQVSSYEAKIKDLKIQMEEKPSDNVNKLAASLQGLSGIQELTRELVVEFISEIKVHTPECIEIIWKYGDVFEQMQFDVDGKQ
jgi:DNA invertase Pin-like site-specific DNA recombinase